MDEEALHAAIARGRTSVVSQWLAARPEGDLLTQHKGLVAHAARSGQDAICEMLVSHGADIDDRDLDGMTALMWAAANVEVQLVRMLLAHGANPNLRTRSGGAPGTEREPGVAADLARLKMESKGGEPTWTRCAQDCIAVLALASAKRREHVRLRLRAAFHLVTAVLAWHARAMDRLYAPGGAGYCRARDDFAERRDKQQQEGAEAALEVGNAYEASSVTSAPAA